MDTQMSRPWISFATIIILFSPTAVGIVNRYITHYDLTKDGKVDSRELRTIAYMDHKLPPTISDDIFRKADRNGDKFIDRTEIIAAARLVQRHDHDTDGDGLLNEVELFESIYMELGLSIKDVKSCFRESDVNNDKYLTSSELVETLHCSRLLAQKEAKELLKIYDTDGDHRLNIREAQMLADLRYDIKPSYATIVFEDVSHRTDHTINELELIDFLTKLREQAAIAALNKLSSIDQNGDEALSFSELLQGYEKQLKKSILKKIFGKVDVNKNAHIDPIEFVSLQNLIADEIRLQTIQNNFEQQYSTTVNATTSLPTLIIFRLPKKTYNQQPTRQRKRRSDQETDKKLMVSDESHPSIKELTAINASSIYFSTVVTSVPKFMKSKKEYQKFPSSEANSISEMFSNSKRPENRDVIEIDNIKNTEEYSVSVENTSPLIRTMVQRDRKFTSAKNEDQLEADSIRIDQSGVRNENKAFINSPNAAYIKKFEKFFNFLQNTIKKISKAVKENSEKQAEDLKGPLRGINITKHWSQIANNTSNTEANETKKIANVPENSISTLTTTTELKIQRDLDDAIYERTRNEKDFVVHTPIDSSKYKITAAKKFSGLFDAPFLQFDEKETGKKVKIINYQSNGSLDKRNFHNAVEKEQKPMDEDGCILNNQADSSDSDDSSEYSVKQLKCNIQAQTSNETNSTASLQKIKRAKLSPETNEESRNQKKQDKPSNITGSLEYEIIPVSHKVSVDDEAVKVILESEDDEEFNEDTSTKHINSNQSEHEFTNKHDKFTFQPLHSQLTENHEKQIHNGPDFTGFEKTTAKTKEKKLSSGDKSVNEFRLIGKESNKYKILEANSMFSIEKNVTNKHDQEVYPRSQITDFQLTKSQNLSFEQEQLQVINTKYQTNSSKEDEFFDKVLSGMLNATFSEMDQTFKATKSESQGKKDFQKITKSLLKLKKNDAISQIPQTSATSFTAPKIPVTLPSSPKTSTSATTNPNFSTQTTIMQSNSKTAVGVESDKINQTFIELSTMAHPATDLKDNKDTHESSVENTGTVKDFAEFIPNMERNGKSEAGEQHIEEVRLLQQKRKKCSHHRHGSQRKCPNMDNISAEDTAAKINTTQVNDARDVICDKKKLLYECRLKKKYRSKICSSNQRCTFLSHSIETSENIDLPKQDFSQKNETAGDWRMERTEDLLFRAVQEYQASLRNQEKGTEN
ncbi:unnamed protein product [Wuchereria bancrofti]|uniref:EF-hand domain-containing protein n=1 Tax=Wuchereria bancrofti TaxID=6293 RepID=A0A3P7DF85_WUCBA|nr:unnamed protein product [Wuchereria bancrofti]